MVLMVRFFQLCLDERGVMTLWHESLFDHSELDVEQLFTCITSFGSMLNINCNTTNSYSKASNLVEHAEEQQSRRKQNLSSLLEPTQRRQEPATHLCNQYTNGWNTMPSLSHTSRTLRHHRDDFQEVHKFGKIYNQVCKLPDDPALSVEQRSIFHPSMFFRSSNSGVGGWVIPAAMGWEVGTPGQVLSLSQGLA